MSRLLDFYNSEGRKKLQKQIGDVNPMAIPKLMKIVINIGTSEALKDKKAIDTIGSQLSSISGQKVVVTRAKRDISSFKLRKGDPIGLKVTMRKKQMYNFMDKLISIALPRIRDFRGVKHTGFDTNGNYTLGIIEQIIFPEIEYGQIDKMRGMEITFVIQSRAPAESLMLLEVLGLPFEKIAK